MRAVARRTGYWLPFWSTKQVSRICAFWFSRHVQANVENDSQEAVDARERIYDMIAFGALVNGIGTGYWTDEDNIGFALTSLSRSKFGVTNV